MRNRPTWSRRAEHAASGRCSTTLLATPTAAGAPAARARGERRQRAAVEEKAELGREHERDAGARAEELEFRDLQHATTAKLLRGRRGRREYVTFLFAIFLLS